MGLVPWELLFLRVQTREERERQGRLGAGAGLGGQEKSAVPKIRVSVSAALG